MQSLNSGHPADRAAVGRRRTPHPRHLPRRAIALAAGWLLVPSLLSSVAQADVSLPGPSVEPGKVISWGGPANMQDLLQPPDDPAVAIAASDTPGTYSSLALRPDGTVVGWGLNKYGETSVPKDLGGAVAIDVGAGFSLALRSDGSVVAWGSDDAGQTDVPQDLGPVTAIAAGGYLGYQGYGLPYLACGYAIALRADGTVARWGQDRPGLGCDQIGARMDPPAGLSDVVAISAGDRQALALRSDGTVVAWGPGVTSGLDGTPPDQWSNVVAVSSGTGNSLGVRSDGSVSAYGIWGESGPPQVGNVMGLSASQTDLFLHSDTSVSAYPSVLGVPTGLGYQAVAAGNGYGLAIEASSPPALGSAAVQPAVDTNPSGSAEAFQATALGDTSASSFHLFLDSKNTAETVIVGVYSDSGGEPGVLLSSGRSDGVVAGQWNTIPLQPVTLQAGQQYWLALLAPKGTGTIQFRDLPDGSGAPTRLSARTDLSGVRALPRWWRSGADFANAPASAYLS